MFAILLIALCVVTAHAQYYSMYYSCPPENDAIRLFRAMTGDLRPQEMPTVDQAEKDLQRAPEEIQELAKNALSEALSYKAQFELLIRPFVYRCCEKPEYRCSSVNIPMRFIRHYYHQCFVIYPAGEKAIHYTKCTCMTCVRDSYCPIIGRCVETDYVYHHILVYCPTFYYSHRYKILLVAVAKNCQCMTYCPYNSYGYGYKKSALGFASQSGAARSSATAEGRDGSEDEGLPGSSDGDIPPP